MLGYYDYDDDDDDDDDNVYYYFRRQSAGEKEEPVWQQPSEIPRGEPPAAITNQTQPLSLPPEEPLTSCEALAWPQS